MKKHTFIIGTVSYFILTILAYVFFVERTVFIDLSFHLFHILKDNDFAIQNNRFGAVFTQSFPILAQYIGLSLKDIMIIYSVGFVLYYYAIFFICVKVLKSNNLGLVMLLLSTLMVSDTFYWVQSELPQGLAFLVLFLAVIDFSSKQHTLIKWSLYPIMFIMIVTLVFFHPLLVFPFVFSVLFLYLSKSHIRHISLLSLAAFIVVYGFKSVFFKTGYDSSAIGGLKNFILFFPNYVFLESNYVFLNILFTKFYFLLLLLIAMVFYYIMQKKFKKLVLMLSFFIGYLMLVNVSYPNSADDFYIENLYLPLTLFVALPFALDFSLLNAKRYTLFICILLFIRLTHIGMTHESYTNRVDYLTSYLEKTNNYDNRKLIVNDVLIDKETLKMTWGSPYEFWLLSTYLYNDSRSIIFTDRIKDFQFAEKVTNQFVTTWRVYDYSDFPSSYFMFNDTSTYVLKN